MMVFTYRTMFLSYRMMFLTYRKIFSHYHFMFYCFAQAGLWEVTSDISKLVNLRVLTLLNNWKVRSIPDSISCLQKLEHLRIENSLSGDVPDGLSTLSNLASLHITWDPNHPEFPADLRVSNDHNNINKNKYTVPFPRLGVHMCTGNSLRT
jgi:hypothetical protein